MEKRWQPGDGVILRNTGFFVGEAWATPHVVIEDRDDLVVLYRPEGTRFEAWSIAEQRLWQMPSTRMNMLRLMFPGRWYSVELFFDAGNGTPPYAHFRNGDGRFRGWKVNIEAPFLRTDLGFDTTDHFLDIIMTPDRRWHWKDGEAVAMWHARGAYSDADIDALYAACKDVEALVTAAQPPFDDEWIDWTPDAEIAPAPVPRGWQLLPGVEITRGFERRWDHWVKR